MPNRIEVDVWIRGTLHAATHRIEGLAADAALWSEADARTLLTGMLRAVQRQMDPDGDPGDVTLRGFSWIVSPDDKGGVLVHLELQSGTASAGPFAIDEQVLTSLITRALRPPTSTMRLMTDLVPSNPTPRAGSAIAVSF